ncbi:trypsin-like peptidase domain-containing protein [Candidatus Uabimicrobium amorphum]|uniref:MucD n=1 Tax=Uabimicrobium amorphum TaxID=2596890 RepID=A0A5S9F2C5_UABAM|nr:trypsin-like peptidase domain-containing protein [Candidatus Uabimicrobium amorphum]BBM83527.1 MucD [Candidatus Uabimicrobium amorphum]
MSEKKIFCAQCSQEQECIIDPFNGKILCAVCNECLGQDAAHGPVAKSGNEDIVFGEQPEAKAEKTPLVIDIGAESENFTQKDIAKEQISDVISRPDFYDSMDAAYDHSRRNPFLFFLVVFFLCTVVSVICIVYFLQRTTRSVIVEKKVVAEEVSPLEQLRLLESLRIERTQKVVQSVVIIENTTSLRANSFKQGTGFIIDELGHVVTNHHVISQNLGNLQGILHNRRRVNFLLHSYDEISDIAILKIIDFSRVKGEVSRIEWGDSQVLKTGSHIWTLAHPRGLFFSLISGFVSHDHRYLAAYVPKKEYSSGGFFHCWIQVDAAITEGVSGGPLFNLDGEVVGVNTRRSEYPGLGFCVPSNHAREVVNELLSFKQIIRNTLGVIWRPQWHIQEKQGAIINIIIPDSSAAKAGLQSGDVVLEINKQPITCRYHSDLPALRKIESELSSDEQTILKFRRKEKLYEARLFPDLRKPFHNKVIFFRHLKFWGIPISPSLQAYLKTPQQAGIWIIDVHPTSPLFKAGVAKNDLLLGINQNFKTSSDFIDLYQNLPRKKFMRLIVQTGQNIRKLRFWSP